MKLITGIILILLFGWAYYRHDKDIIEGKWGFTTNSLRAGAAIMIIIGIVLIVLHFFDYVHPSQRTFIIEHPYYTP